jgi:putative ABC transport system permease protein
VRKRFLYLRLALSNLLKNRQTYLSFFLSSVCTIFVFYTFTMIALNDGIRKMRGAQSMQVLMVLGAIVVAIFALIFLFYANSFLIKRRKKELGLYAILGLEKKHIARILFHEMTALLIVSLITGIGLGIALGKLMFLLIQALMRINTSIVFQVSQLPLLITAGLFTAVFFCLLLYNRLQVHLSSPVNLLKGQQKGEREPKTRWLLALIGIAAMGIGYWLAITVGNPLEALSIFFIAVILVIIGTYTLFTAGSVAFLKTLRRNKGYFYRPRNFISVSGMIYRMKQNAAGLAGICILSTMAIITIGTTVALYVGQTNMLRDMYPMDHVLSYQENELDPARTVELIQEKAQENKVDISDLHQAIFVETAIYREGNVLGKTETNSIKTSKEYENVWTLFLLPLDEYNRLAGSAYTLGENEALLFESRNGPAVGSLTAGSTVIRIKENLSQFPISHKNNKGMEPPMYLIVKDRETAEAINKSLGGPDAETFKQGFWWNSNGNDEALLKYSEDVRNAVNAQKINFNISSVDATRRDWYAMYGGFLFLGVFLGLLFLMATTLIIYFKQVSEGYMDHDRFIILQQVGMSRDEVRATVRKQILSVFILPIVAAILHTCGALHMMTEMLSMFGLGDKLLIALSIFLTAGVFALLYGMVYTATARTYYKMVRMDQ